MTFNTASFVGKAGIAPLSITVNAPQPLANLRAFLSRSSSCKIQFYVSKVHLKDLHIVVQEEVKEEKEM